MKKLRSVWFLVVGSIVFGFVLSLLLSLVVFSGAIEPVITGSIMLSFGLGWLALGLLTSRYTDQPQVWAYVPAAYFGLVGLLLLIVRPGNSFMSASGWIWPFLVLALTIWSYLQVRSSLRSRTRRWVVYPVLLVLILLAIGGIYEKIQERTTAHQFAMAGKLVDVGGYKLHINCTGEGTPTTLLESGLGDTAFAMEGWIAPSVTKHTRTCVYDRAGRGWSESSPTPLDGKHMATALHTLLYKSGEKGPFVLAGHSAGGVYILNYALSYPKDVAGVILLDSMSPYQYEKIPGWQSFYAMFTRGSALLPTLSRVGVLRVMMASAYGDYPAPVADQERNALSSPDLYRSERDEFSVIRNALTRAQQLHTLNDKPLYVISAKGSYPEWSSRQNDLASLSSNSIHVTLSSAEHTDLVEKKNTAAESSQAITSVIEAVRTGKPLEK